MTEHDDLALKRTLDALPKDIAPPEGEWPRIRARLAPRRSRRVTAPLRAAALLTLLAVSAGALVVARRDAGRWTVATGSTAARTLEPGEAIAAGQTTRLTVGTIGVVDMDAGTRASLLEAGWSAHRLGLRQGTIHARINAPPRLFVVETPAGDAVDLGCAYTLEVDSNGTSRIHVTEGWVAFEARGEAALIPAGMRAVMKTGGRLGTPLRDSAGAGLTAAAALFDSTGAAGALAAVLAAAGREDAVSLWHLVGRTGGEQREQVVDRLTALVPLPPALSRADLLAADARAMQLYWTALPGTLPIIPGWRRTLWLAWLRVFG